MTLRCDLCGGIVELIDDNGAEYPQNRTEYYRCEECGRRKTVVLTA